MIVTDCNITVNDNKSLADKNIVVYRGDFNIQVTFSITQSNGFKYLSTTNNLNLIESTNASYAQMIVKLQNSDEVVILTEIEPTKNGKVTLTIIKEYIDELVEVGAYDYQIRLFSAEQQARLTIPPVSGQLIVKEPIMFLDDSATINLASVGTAIVSEDDIDVPVFDNEGNYNKTEWHRGDVITESKLNKIEDAIYTINNDNGDYATKDELENKADKSELENLAPYDWVQYYVNSTKVVKNLENILNATFDKLCEKFEERGLYYTGMYLKVNYYDPDTNSNQSFNLPYRLIYAYVGTMTYLDVKCNMVEIHDYKDSTTYKLVNYNNTMTLASIEQSVATKQYVQDAISNLEIPEGGGDIDLSNYATKEDIPTNVSAFTNDAGYLTQHQSINHLATKEELNAALGNIESLLGKI